MLQGKKVFMSAGCSACHTPSFVTGESPDSPHLSKQTIFPYSDLLLHDMGIELEASTGYRQLDCNVLIPLPNVSVFTSEGGALTLTVVSPAPIVDSEFRAF